MSLSQLEEWFDAFRQFGYIPGFINIIASLSHIKIKYYFFVLVISKLISITILGVMGKEIFTIFTNPLRALIMIVLLVVLWFISKKVEKHFMGSTKE